MQTTELNAVTSPPTRGGNSAYRGPKASQHVGVEAQAYAGP